MAAALLRRLPSFRRSVRVSSSANDSVQPTERTSVDGSAASELEWTVEEGESYIASLDGEELRQVLSHLVQTHANVREALQKHQKAQSASRPTLPHANHSMNKKRRAETDLDRTVDPPSSSNNIVKTEVASTTSQQPETESATASHQREPGTTIIEGQKGLVLLPSEHVNEAAEGSESEGGDSTHSGS